MFGNSSENEGGGLLVESVLLGESQDKLGKNFIGDDRFSEIFRIVSQSTKSEGG